MLLLLPFWLALLLVSVSLGRLMYRGLCNWVADARETSLPPELLSLLGLCGLSVLLALLSFVVRLGGMLPWLLVGLAVAYTLRHAQAGRPAVAAWFRSLTASWLGTLLPALFGGLVLLHTVQVPHFPDSGLYHAQFIRWAQQYPVVPGLGNLHGRLAFNSHLHLLAAISSPAPETGWPPLPQVLPGYLFLLFVSYQVRGFGRQLQRRHWLAWWYLLTLLGPLLVLRPWIASPMPDSGLTLLVLLVLGWALEREECGVPRLRADVLAISMVALTAVTFKLSGAYLLSLPAWYLLRMRPVERFSYASRLLLLALVVLLPWLGRNYLLSGYLYYPLPGFVLSAPDWQIPAAQVRLELAEVVRFARHPAADWFSAGNVPLRDWLPFWYGQQEPADKALLWLLLAVPIGVAAKFVGDKTSRVASGYYVLYLLLLGGTGAWFASAPALRFGYGYLLGVVGLGLSLLLAPRASRLLLYGALLLSIAYAVNGSRNELRKLPPAALLRPADYPKPPLRTVLVQGRPVLIPTEGGRCWNAPVPCTSEPIPHLEWRGASVAAGFRTRFVAPAVQR